MNTEGGIPVVLGVLAAAGTVAATGVVVACSVVLEKLLKNYQTGLDNYKRYV